MREGLPFRLKSHPCWRAPGIAVFAPSGELSAEGFAAALEAPREDLGRHRALRSNNVTMVQDPERRALDLLAAIRRNPRAAVDFPDLLETHVSLARSHAPDGHEVLIVQEEGSSWPREREAWTLGEMNRVDAGPGLHAAKPDPDAMLYELPANLGQIGPRATVVARLAAPADPLSRAILVDMGHRDGDMGVERPRRARIDYTALSRLGYETVVPYEFELALGTRVLWELRQEFPSIRFLAANLKAPVIDLFDARRVVEVAGLRIGLFGLVDPELKAVLAKSSLAEFTIEPPVAAAEREARALREAGVDAVVALSNLQPRDNAMVAREVKGIDVILADFHERWSPEVLETAVELPSRPYSRPGSPALVARSFGNGLGVGRLDLAFRPRSGGGFSLLRLRHRLESVTDRMPADTALVAEVQALASREARPRGDLMVPAFDEMVQRRPTLARFDEVAAQGRISQRMWEQFLARVVRRQGRAEISILRKLPHFPPLIGKLHEPEVRSWLWTEEAIVLLDLLGSDLRKILLEDVREDLVTNGIDRAAGTVNGRKIDDATFYRVATTDLLFEGARFRAFQGARRVRRLFRVVADGSIMSDGRGRSLALRDYVLGELARIRAMAGKGEAHTQRVADLMDREPHFQPLLTFTFDHPTIFASVSDTANNEAYGAARESRVTANDSLVLGVAGRLVATHDRRDVGLDLGTTVAYSRQSATTTAGTKIVTETADDLKLDLTVRRNAPSGTGQRKWQPFLRAVFDSEFTPTVNPQTGMENPRQLLLRGLAGFSLAPTPTWKNVQFGLVLQQDLAVHKLEPGLQLKADLSRRFGPLGKLTYRLRNDATYLFHSKKDDASDLGLTYNMVHEVLIPFIDELSLSVGVDVFFYRGKVEATSKLGTSAILRVGITYDRLWKPRYQPLF